MSFVSHSARTATVNNDYNDDYSNSDSTNTAAEANNGHNNNDKTITNGPASMAEVVLRLARSKNNNGESSSRIAMISGTGAGTYGSKVGASRSVLGFLRIPLRPPSLSPPLRDDDEDDDGSASAVGERPC